MSLLLALTVEEPSLDVQQGGPSDWLFWAKEKKRRDAERAKLVEPPKPVEVIKPRKVRAFVRYTEQPDEAASSAVLGPVPIIARAAISEAFDDMQASASLWFDSSEDIKELMAFFEDDDLLDLMDMSA